MVSYEKLARYYDLAHTDHDYERDCDFLESLFHKHGFQVPVSILDIGCGTGEHSIRLLERGHHVTGIDSSLQMLARAKSKAAERGLPGEFYNQDMRRIEIDAIFDSAICLFGAFARLSTKGDFFQFFQGLKSHLKEGGLFVFDFINSKGVTSPHKDWRITRKDDLTLIKLDRSEMTGTVLDEHHEFLVLKGDRLLDRLTENHRLQTHTFPDVLELAEEEGFSLVHPTRSSPSTREPFGMRVAVLKRREPRKPT